MIAQRAAAFLASLVTLILVAVTPAWAANYPPGGGDDGVDVGGVKTGRGVLDSGSGLASTGFDMTYLWVGIAVLAVGVVMLVSMRRRTHS